MDRKNKLQLCEFLYLPTTRCNCRCKHCAPPVYTGKPNEMSSQKLIERYEESFYLQNNSISVGGGEPFVKEDIDEFIVYLDRKKIPCIISTNGFFTEKIEGLLNKLEDFNTVKFSISIDGIGAVHDDIRGVKGVYNRAMASAKLIKEKGGKIQINTVAQKANLSQIAEMKEMFGELDIPLNIIPKMKVNNEEFEYEEEQIRQIYPDILLPREKKLLLSKGEYEIKSNCHAAKNSWLLDSNGDVYACLGCYYGDEKEKYFMGNLIDQPFDEIYTSKRAKEVYENVVKSCKGCATPCDMEREVSAFNYSTEYTLEEVSLFSDCITNDCHMEEVHCDNYNWNDLEEDGNGKYRWTKNTTANLFLKAQAGYSKIVIDFLNVREFKENGDEIWMECKINGIDVGSAICELGEQQCEFSLEGIELPHEELVKVTIETNIQWSPKFVGMGEDNRKLGIAVRRVVIC